jgi:predicted Rossmann fold flavoprotein
MKVYDVIIIGAGPAGLMAASELSNNNISYLLLEKNATPGKKLLLTGNGRCNVTNHQNVSQFISQLTLKHKRFLYSSLQQFGPEDIRNYFDKMGVPLYLDGPLKYFPKSNKARDILDVLLLKSQSNIKYNSSVTKVSKKDALYKVNIKKTSYLCQYLIVATGSNSFPKTGSSGDGLHFAKSLNQDYFAFYPAETSVYSNYIKNNKEVFQGIQIQGSDVRIKGTKIHYKDDLLFTHKGLSGPVIYRLSEDIYKQGNTNVTIQVSLTQYTRKELESIIKQFKDKHIIRFIEHVAKKRLAKFLSNEWSYTNKLISNLSPKEENRLIERLTAFDVVINKVEDKTLAYVNGGGIDTKGLMPKSFESKTNKRLYWIGEVVDIHGPIGGYNITIALSSAVACANAIKEDINA